MAYINDIDPTVASFDTMLEGKTGQRTAELEGERREYTPEAITPLGNNDFGSHFTTVAGGPQEVVVFNSNGKQITVKIDGDEAEADMEVLVFAHQGEGGGRHTLEINYSLTWATEIKRGIDMMIKHGEISVDSSLIPYMASLVGRTTTADVREVLGADNAVVELAIEILSCAPDANEIVGSQRLDELISISRWGDSIGGIVCTFGVLKEAGIILYSCTEARMLLRQ